MPHLCHYYWATNINKIMLCSIYSPSTNWYKFESISCTSSSLATLVISSFPLPVTHFTNNPVVINTFRICFQFRQNIWLIYCLGLNPISNNHLFPKTKLDSTFCLWQRHGIFSFKTLNLNAKFASFDCLSCKLGPAYSIIFKSTTYFRSMTPIFLTCQSRV